MTLIFGDKNHHCTLKKQGSSFVICGKNKGNAVFGGYRTSKKAKIYNFRSLITSFSQFQRK